MSKTWLLAKANGDTNFSKGDADLVWQNGAPVEIVDPLAIIDQRFRKTSMTPLGSNPFNQNIGFPQKKYLGKKNIGEDTAKQMASDFEAMVSAMKISQTEVASRVPLDPNELISSIKNLQYSSVDDEADVTVVMETQGGAVVPVTVSGLTNGLS